MARARLIKSTGVISAATAISRILGFVRDIVIASLFGTSPAAQSFFVAFRIPNSLRDLVGEGAMNSAIVPVLTDYKTRGEEKEFLHVSRVLFNISLVSLSVLTLLGIIFSPFIVRIIAPGFIRDNTTFNLTVMLNRIIFPYLILIGLTAYTMGILNTLHHFAAPAFGPCLLNIAMIGSAVLLCPRMGIAGLVIGVLIGGILQLSLNMAVMRKKGLTIDFNDGLKSSAVKKIGVLMAPRAFGSAIYQANIFVDTILASLAWVVGEGGVAALYYANRLIQFPLAIFGLAIAQATLPRMSQEFSVNDLGKLKQTLSLALRGTFLVMLPASVGLAILGTPIIKILFQRGEFSSYSTSITQSALFYYAFGMWAYSGVKLLTTCFYSMQDTKTPVKMALFALMVNVVLNLILMWPMKLGGLALATSISATLNFIILYNILKNRIGRLGTREIAASFSKILLASLIMGIVLKFLSAYSFSIRGLIISIAAGIMVFIISAYILKVKEIKYIFTWISKRR